MPAPGDGVEEIAPAKINLALHVLGRRPDGFHELESLVAFSPGAGDRLSFAPADRDGLEITGPFAAALSSDGDNLVARARDHLREAFAGHPCPPVQIGLEKNLPVASGLGGGSSDAAAALHGLAKLWGLPDDSRVGAIAERLGADVPMCLFAKPLIARGSGERLEPLPDFPALAVVLANPGVSLATAAVFAALASRENPGLPPLPPSPGFSALLAWLRQTRNDLEPPASTLAPEIRDVLAALDGAGAAFSRMSGSGATCFGLFATPVEAAQAALALASEQPGWFIKGTIAEPLHHAA
ncbi:MAG TPA: 4-(cytidine 5'-diphospho)-2-C-methyl-D-erythritol kinase [Mesorhizobium sp.]|nr:4-(cytidine 5'-diphospho)-2-C-methyl-D-erythritol kinase [Mesorhizobium sp.]